MHSLLPFDPMSPFELAISNIFVAILIIGLLVFLLVTVWLTVNIVRFRHRPGQPEPYQEYGQRKVELIWTITPAVLLAVVFVFTVNAMAAADPAPASHQQPDIIVIGHQWWWEVRYPASGVVAANEIYLPTGKRLLVRLESVDVIHSLWVPQLARKMDLVPGQINEMWIEADKPGIYDGACAEYCGTEHAWMRIQAIAVSPAAFTSWEQAQNQHAITPTSGLAAAGAKLFQEKTCVNCHTIAGTAAHADVGPNLTHFASRRMLGGGVLTNTPANVAKWMTNPQAVKPGVHMPNFQFNSTEVRELTAYLETLR